MGCKAWHRVELHSAWQAAAERLRGAIQPDGALRMALAILLGRPCACAALRNRTDVAIQSRAPEHGPWRYNAETAAHGRGIVSTSAPR